MQRTQKSRTFSQHCMFGYTCVSTREIKPTHHLGVLSESLCNSIIGHNVWETKKKKKMLMTFPLNCFVLSDQMMHQIVQNVFIVRGKIQGILLSLM